MKDLVIGLSLLGMVSACSPAPQTKDNVEEDYCQYVNPFIGNADTRILLSGSREEIYSEVKRCMDIGKACPGFIMAVGNHIPPNTPVENCLYYNEVFEKLRRR